MIGFRRQSRGTAGILGFTIALVGLLACASPVRAQPTIQQVSINSSPWVGITTDTDTIVSRHRHRPASMTGDLAFVSRPATLVRPQGPYRSSIPSMMLVMHRKIPASPENSPDAH